MTVSKDSINGIQLRATPSGIEPETTNGYIPRDYTATPQGSRTYAAPFNLPLIPRSEWDARYDEMVATKSSLKDICVAADLPALYQDGLGYCHGFAVAGAIMGLRCSQNGNCPKLSGSSVAAPVVGFVNKGAWILDDLAHVVQYGANTVEDYPELTTSSKYWTPANQAKAAANRVTEWYDMERRNFAQTMTCLFTRTPVCVGLNWWGHAVWYAAPIRIERGSWGVILRNSHKEGNGTVGWEILREDKATPDEQYAPKIVTPN